jgi:hypothetical protein
LKSFQISIQTLSAKEHNEISIANANGRRFNTSRVGVPDKYYHIIHRQIQAG